MKLTENQIGFLLETFFKNTDYAGWRTIGRKLLIKGSCVVAGSSCIWTGTLGNFINIVESENYVDCVEYNFNLEHFLSSAWYIDTKENYLSKLKERKLEIEKKFNEIDSI